MRKKLFDPERSPSCSYCLHGRVSPDGISILCVKKGVVRPDASCKRFGYDPLKRKPKKQPALPEYDAGEFSLD